MHCKNILFWSRDFFVLNILLNYCVLDCMLRANLTFFWHLVANKKSGNQNPDLLNTVTIPMYFPPFAPHVLTCMVVIILHLKIFWACLLIRVCDCVIMDGRTVYLFSEKQDYAHHQLLVAVLQIMDSTSLPIVCMALCFSKRSNRLAIHYLQPYCTI